MKWLLNERAALSGAAQLVSARQERLAERIQVLERKAEELQASMTDNRRQYAQKMEAISALDATLELIHSGVDPASAGCVNAWQGKYGDRGALKAFLLQSLRDAAPEPLSTTDALKAVIRNFKLTMEFKEERFKLRQTVVAQFHRFRDQGLIVGLHDPLKTSSGLWRWKQPTPLAAFAAQEAAHDHRTR